MRNFTIELKIENIVEQAKGTYVPRFATLLTNVAELEDANETSVCFYENEAYVKKLKACKAGLIIVHTNFDDTLNTHSNLLKVDKPYFTFMVLVKLWLEMDKQTKANLISAKASIANSATIGMNVAIGDFVVIGDNVKIGNDTVIEANCVIRQNSVIGDNCHFFPNCTIYDNMEIGNGVILHAGVVVGADGFGYILYNNNQEKVPQIGNVIIKDNVEIGANTCIDRGTIGPTIIGENTKVDNLVQIGHNVRIGKNTIVCAHVGIAGSTEIGDLVYLAGQVGVADHSKIGNRVLVGAQSGIHGIIQDDSKMLGYPACDISIRKRIMAAEIRLPEMYKYYLKLKKKEEKEK